jgi:hypothetical protein
MKNVLVYLPISGFKRQIDREFWKLIAVLFIAKIAYTYLVADVIAVLLGVGGFDQSFGQMDNLSIWSALLIAPVIEELLFRFHLSGKRYHGCFFLIPLISLMIVFRELWFFGLLAISLFLGYMIWDSKKYPEKANLSKGMFYTIFILTAIIFAALHYGNVEAENQLMAIGMVVIAITPASLLYGYIRYKKGLQYSMAVHGISNFTIITLNGLIYH